MKKSNTFFEIIFSNSIFFSPLISFEMNGEFISALLFNLFNRYLDILNKVADSNAFGRMLAPDLEAIALVGDVSGRNGDGLEDLDPICT